MRTFWCLLIIAVGAGAGCVELPLHWFDAKPVPARPSGPVTAEAVTQHRAHEMADALQEELDRENQKDAKPGTGSAAKKSAAKE
jgi:hypothetical protein